MKKVTICFIIMLMFCGLFGLVLQNILPGAPVGGIAYADPVAFEMPGQTPPPPHHIIGFGP